MSTGGSLRVALLHSAFGRPWAEATDIYVSRLATGLEELGHQPTIVTARERCPRPADHMGKAVHECQRALEVVLDRRGFAGRLTTLPATALTLARGDFDIVHAFSALDAWPAIHRRGGAKRQLVLSFTEPVQREQLANRRLALHMLASALEASAAVVVPDERVALSVKRWLMVSPVIAESAEAVAASYTGLARTS